VQLADTKLPRGKGVRPHRLAVASLDRRLV
jgi:hypothetical protein